MDYGGIEMQATTKQKFTTKDLVESSLLIALVFIATKFINIRLPISINGGLIHLGNVILFTSAIVFGKRKGALAGGIGMALFDLVSGWTLWAPFTLVLRGIMGYIIGKIAWANNKNGDNTITNIIAIILAGIWMLVGYYVTEVLLYGNIVSPLTSIPGNIVQILIGLILGVPLAKILKRYIKIGGC